MARQAHNWGGYPATRQRVHNIFWQAELNTATLPAGPLLAHGNGRSQGDVGLCSQGTLLGLRGLNRLMHFDPATNQLTAEAGITLHEILQFAVPRGLMLPVVPGTRFVTLGGAIANDVHGKNHHAPIAEGGGSFGHHVTAIGLWRTDVTQHGGHQTLMPTTALFTATIGGLGLTGIITHATVQLFPMQGKALAVQNIQTKTLEDLLASLQQHQAPYSVAWLSLTAPEAELGSGWLEAAAWVRDDATPASPPSLPKLGLPMPLPFNLWQPPVVKAFNAVWLKRPRAAVTQVPYSKFFWPLDGVANWQQTFGPASFVQMQAVVPFTTPAATATTLRRLLQTVRLRGKPTFLNTLKLMGDHPPAGLCSFPRAGVALALDLLFEGEQTLALLRTLESLVLEAGGAIYPAKDSALSAAAFAAMYPRAADFKTYRDPRITSDFYERATHG